ncbi:serine hydrolase [Sporolactobacillus pectinivorans]|uniref:serine hydrolase n=1 Tax=Sporolactobacillus pectinivorans TaxID=1591408 RepID=UPI000C26741B|nr:serine hydrolase [Sporolactobacillus pectinivorans]
MPELNDKLSEEMDTLSAPFSSHIAIKAEGSDGFHFALHESVPMLSASLIKLPILLYACDQAVAKPELFAQKIELREGKIVGGSGVLQILSRREWSVRDLLALMINVSDNTATNLLIESFGTDAIQNWIQKQGYLGTTLGRKLMDETAEAAGRHNLISAGDACRMIQKVFKMDQSFSSDIKSWFLHQQFRGKLPALFDELPHSVTVYNKTGEMEKVDHDTAYFSCRSHNFSIAVLTNGIEDRQAALSVIQNIGKKIFDYLTEWES